MNRDKNVKCGVCTSIIPAAIADIHHITPQSVGLFPDNSNENIIWLCPTCHKSIHIVSRKLVAGRQSEAIRIASDSYANDVYIKRIMSLAAHCARESIALKEGERDLPAQVTLSIDIPRSVYTTLQIMSIERRGQRQLSPFILSILIGLAARYDGENSGGPDITHKNF